jgi:tol-pal system protein YbgF
MFFSVRGEMYLSSEITTDFMQKFSHFIAIAILSISASTPVFAQSMNSDGARVEKIERDLMLLQRQVSRSGGGSSGGAAPAGSAELEVRLSAIEEQLREMSGKAEENEFKIRKLTENLDKLQRDTDFRFGELAHAPVAQPTPANTLAPVSGQRKVPDENLKAEVDKNVRSLGKTVDTVPPPSTANTPDNNAADDALETEFANSRDHYNYAFRLLNQTQYDKASESFAAFIKKYPKDPLVGNAYYWQGETFYIRRDYVKAADSFRQGFEELPSGPKAPDNLLKLAMTLNALKRDKEACVVLGQVVSKFKTTSAAVSQKADQERKRIDCK